MHILLIFILILFVGYVIATIARRDTEQPGTGCIVVLLMICSIAVYLLHYIFTESCKICLT